MNKYQIKLTRVWDTYAEIEALTMEDAMTMYDSMVERGEMAQKELEQMGISDESYKITLQEPASDTEFFSTPTPPKVWRDNDQVEGQYYARQCDITAEGMYEGWVVGGGDYYIKYESDAIEYCQREWNQTLQEAYNESEENGGDGFYHTSWFYKSEYQYRLVDGVLVDEDDERFPYDYEEPIDEDTLKQEYMTSTEEMQHRMAMILDDMKVIRAFINEQGLDKVFQKPTSMADECWTHLNNIEIACDIDDNECLTWSKFSRG
jgi:5-methylcytosine-specific restriction endonuclease McrBC GTP-binding regulatory subunit McrB